MKLFVAGSRSISDFDIEPYIPENVDRIICGGAYGVDALAEKYADKNKLSKTVLQPEYKKYGRKAPLLRNVEMVEMCDEALVIWDGKSTGTLHSITELIRTAKSFRVVVVKS